MRLVPLDQLTLSAFQAVINTNLTGSFLCTREAFKVFREQGTGGRIINNGSLAAHVPRPHSVAYTTSKHAITGLTKQTALDGREFNIACTQIDIGASRYINVMGRLLAAEGVGWQETHTQKWRRNPPSGRSSQTGRLKQRQHSMPNT